MIYDFYVLYSHSVFFHCCDVYIHFVIPLVTFGETQLEKLKSDESGDLKVTINPDSDRAFVTAIIVILDQLKRISFDLPCWPLMAAGHVVAGVLESDEL